MLLVAILAIAGVILIDLEIILPGMILGVAGAISLLAALVLVFTTGDLDGLSFAMRSLVALGVLLGSLSLVGLWLKYFDRTSLGSRLVLDPDIDAKIPTADSSLVGVSGLAKTDLRPSGRVEIPGLPKSCDVIAEGGFIEGGSAIEVVKIDGRRVIVRAVKTV